MNYQEFVDSILAGLKEYYRDEAVISVNSVLCNNNGYRRSAVTATHHSHSGFVAGEHYPLGENGR